MSKVERSFICEYCGCTFWSKWDGAKYCSSACRQTAYRRRVKPESGDRDTIAERTIETKRQKQRGKTCKGCGKYFIVDAFHTAQTYCTSACRQKQYRKRAKWRSGWNDQQAIIQAPKIDPSEALRRQLQTAMEMQHIQEEFDRKDEQS